MIARRALPLLAAPAFAQTRPTTRLVVPYAPGGTNDVTARLIAPRAGERLALNWVVENRSGASGAIGTEFVARAAPDGTTLLYSNEVKPLLRHVMRNVPFDNVADFTPVVRTVSIPYVLVGAPRAELPNLEALLAALRTAPQRLAFAASSLGSIGQLGAAAMGTRMGFEPNIVIYRGTGPALNDVLTGAAALMIAPLGPVAQLVHEGRLRAFATTSAQRLNSLPDVPTLIEAGFAEMLFEGWCGIWGPRGMPAEIVARVREAAQAAMAAAEVRTRIVDIGVTVLNESTAEFLAVIAAEMARNGALVRAAGIQPE
ncbi:MAG: tripartite tricarboxylate transporter substrate binding protein [Alphaproteobacteria bacterium]|nr:tripartite tricarboxylate transporter substrate binding protein [Alphaproteobacteria bacterium]